MSKAEIEDQIRRLDERLKTAPAYAVDVLKAHKAVWVKRLAEYKEPEPEPEKPKSKRRK